MPPKVKKGASPLLPPSSWPREMQLLLCCAQTQDSASNCARIDELLDGNLDWQRVLGSAGALGLAPLLHTQLAARNHAAVPQAIRDLLAQDVRILHARNLQTVGALFALLDLFAARGIEVMPFKGPILAVQAYGKLSLRPYSDLDLLVKPKDATAAYDLLIERGYISRYRMGAGQRANLFHFGCEHPFHKLHSATKPVQREDVDLHWNLFPPSFPIAFDTAALWQRTEMVTVANRKVRTIGTEVLILYLCAHGYAHHWSRLEWACSLARLIAVRPETDWSWVRQEAVRMGAERVLELGLILATDWLGAPVPADLIAGARSRATMATLVKHVATRTLRDPQVAIIPESTLNEELFFDLDASENWRRRFSYFLRRLLTPSLEDVEWVALPAALPTLYYLLRPVRLLLRLLRTESRHTTV